MKPQIIRTSKSTWVLKEGKNLRLPSPEQGGPSLPDESFIEAAQNVTGHWVTKPFYATVALTTACNLRCSYCFQNLEVESGGRIRRIPSRTFSHDDVISTVHFIAKRAQNNGYENVLLTLFGGEPLLAERQGIELLSLLNSRIPTHGTLITNGTLLEPSSLVAMAEKGLRSVQISFDGHAQLHDKTRVTASGTGSYRSILEHIRRAVTADVDVAWSIRINLSTPDISVEKLIRDLAQVCIPERTLVYFQFIHDTEVSSLNGFGDDRIMEVALRGYELLAASGFQLPVPRYSANCLTCSEVASTSGCCVGPGGLLYSCLESIGRIDKVVGSTRNGYMASKELASRWTHCDDSSSHSGAVVADANNVVNGWLLDFHYEKGRFSSV